MSTKMSTKIFKNNLPQKTNGGALRRHLSFGLYCPHKTGDNISYLSILKELIKRSTSAAAILSLAPRANT